MKKDNESHLKISPIIVIRIGFALPAACALCPTSTLIT